MRRLLGVLFSIMRALLPWVFRAVRFAGMLALLALAGFWTGIPNAIETIGEEWESRAYRSGISPTYLPFVNHCGQAFGALLILAGWIVLAHGIIVVFLIVS